MHVIFFEDKKKLNVEESTHLLIYFISYMSDCLII